jgi:hypothetical protein
MSEKIEKAMAYMHDVAMKEGRDWISPTEIGRAVGGVGKHSSYGSPICKQAVGEGLMKRNEAGHYSLVVLDIWRK